MDELWIAVAEVLLLLHGWSWQRVEWKCKWTPTAGYLTKWMVTKWEIKVILTTILTILCSVNWTKLRQVQNRIQKRNVCLCCFTLNGQRVSPCSHIQPQGNNTLIHSWTLSVLAFAFVKISCSITMNIIIIIFWSLFQEWERATHHGKVWTIVEVFMTSLTWSQEDLSVLTLVWCIILVFVCMSVFFLSISSVNTYNVC